MATAAGCPALAAIIALVALLATGCATNPVTGRQDFVLFSEQQEVDLGAEYHRRILEEYSLVDDPRITGYVAGVGDRLAAASHRSELDFRFFVLDSALVNAFALPGGYVYVTRGLLAHLQSEAQLAAVLGHEIGHVSARHGIRQHSRGMVVGILDSVANAATGVGLSIGSTSGTIGTALLNGYSRAQELEADGLGSEYLDATGYPRAAMSEVIGILWSLERHDSAREGHADADGYHRVQGSHPQPPERLRRLGDGETADPGEDAAFLGRLEGLAYGPSEFQGLLEGDLFLHRALDLHVELAAGWQHQNRPDRLLSAAPSGDAVIQMTLADPGPGGGAGDYLRHTYPSLRRLTPLRVNGLPAHRGAVTLDTPFGERPSEVAAVDLGDRLVVFAAVHRAEDRVASLEAVIASVRRLTAAERERASPRTIRLHRVESGESYRQLAGSGAGDGDTLARLRLLNDDYPDREPAPGRLVKLFE